MSDENPPQLILGDCLEEMKSIPSGSVDSVIADIPYGTTACKWDSVIPFEPMWEQLKRIIKPNGAIVLFGAQPFTSALIMSNPKMFSYQWIWEKAQATGHLNAYKMPMRKHEDINVFSSNGKLPAYYPILEDKPSENIRPLTPRTKQSDCYGKHGLDKKDTRKIPNNKTLPKTVINFNNDQNGHHPTQKPVPLLEYLIKTYTNQGDHVLDFTMGSGSTGCAAINTGRNFTGIELDPGYFEIAQARITEARQID